MIVADQEKFVSAAAELRKILHSMPEPSMQENKTKEYLLNYIKNNSALEIRDCGKWFYAVWKKSSGYNAWNGSTHQDNAVAFRADFDAVTNENGTVSHLCGHDGHAAALAVFASWISETKPDKTIFLIFQPGEESGEGALLCRQLLKLENIEEIYGVHNIPGVPEGSVVIRENTFACESLGIEIRFKGIPSHAAHPEKGINPSEAIGRLIVNVNEFIRKEHRGMVQATVIGIDCGSRSFGVSASEGTVRFTVRAEFSDEFVEMVSYLTGLSKSLSEEYGMEYDVDQFERFPVTENTFDCVLRIRKAADDAGIKIYEPSEPFRWSEDFGWYTKLIPGAYFGIGAGEKCPSLHSPEYEFPDSIFPSFLKIYEYICYTL